MSLGMTTSIPLEIFIIRVSAAFRFWPMIGMRSADPHQIFPHLRDLAAKVGQGIAKFHHFGGLGGVARADRVKTQCFQFPFAPVQGDLAGGNFNFQPVKAFLDRHGLLVEIGHAHGQVGLGLARLGLFLVPSKSETFCGFPEIP